MQYFDVFILAFNESNFRIKEQTLRPGKCAINITLSAINMTIFVQFL